MSQVESKITKPKLKLPNKFEVLLLNDDYTSMDFVVEVLRKFFHKEFLAAEAIMLKIHIDGEAVCGTYSYDVAQTCLLYTSPSPRDRSLSRMPSSA